MIIHCGFAQIQYDSHGHPEFGTDSANRVLTEVVLRDAFGQKKQASHIAESLGRGEKKKGKKKRRGKISISAQTTQAESRVLRGACAVTRSCCCTCKGPGQHNYRVET